MSGFGIPPAYLHALARMVDTFVPCAILRTPLMRFSS